jgi:cytochrome c oxidase subunit 2
MEKYEVVLEQQAYTAWLQQQRAPATSPTQPQAARGQNLFIGNGCGACHTVRGTLADGTVGPDLTHVGSRMSLGAGTLPNDRASLVRWLSHTDTVKPGVHMPAFGMLPPEDVEALAIYLDGLK